MRSLKGITISDYADQLSDSPVLDCVQINHPYPALPTSVTLHLTICLNLKFKETNSDSTDDFCNAQL